MPTETKKKKFKFTAAQRKWLDALESGEYKQARGYLTRVKKGQQSHCCLGVACNLFKKTAKLTIEEAKSDKDKYLDYNSMCGTAPQPIVDILGLYNDGGDFSESIYIDGVGYDSLIELNDSAKKKFKTIAKAIRANPTLVFTNDRED